MAYVFPNYKTKKALKEALKAGELIEVFEPGLGSVTQNGVVCVKGPHYPQPHTWYAECTISDGRLTRVK
jgi:hypothetical protein